MYLFRSVLWVVAVLCVSPAFVQAKARYVACAFEKLKMAPEVRARAAKILAQQSFASSLSRGLEIRLEGGGEGYVAFLPKALASSTSGPSSALSIPRAPSSRPVVRSKSAMSPFQRVHPSRVKKTPYLFVRLRGERVQKGFLLYTARNYGGRNVAPQRFDFQMSEGCDGKEVGSGDSIRLGFYRAKEAYSRALSFRDLAGRLWFSIQAEEARKIHMGKAYVPYAQRRRHVGRVRGFSTFSGGQAIRENVRSGSLRTELARQKASVPIQDIRGIHIPPYNFTLPIFNKKIALDALASLVPQDQYAVFFPSFGRFTQGFSMLLQYGRLVMGLGGEGDLASRLVRRYQHQLCFDLAKIAKHPSSATIQRVAMTGGDIDFATGTDVALLFQTTDPKGLMEQIQCSAEGVGIVHSKGMIEDLPYTGASSVHREISSFVMAMGDVVVVSNSVAALRRIAHARYEPKESLAALHEYKFFRMRYPHHADEMVFLLVSDEALRLWGSPHIRLLAERRARVRRQILEQTAHHLPELVQGKSRAQRLDIVPDVADGGGLWLEGNRIFSEYYGSLEFMTPLRELTITHITPTEKQAYEVWRAHYESKWRGFFDPIAFRMLERDGKITTDLSVVPLIGTSSLRRWMDLLQGAVLRPKAGDPHREALLHLVSALNVLKSQLYQRTLRQSYRKAEDKEDLVLLGRWIGDNVALYLDDDPKYWGPTLLHPEPLSQITQNLQHLPLALRVQVKDRKACLEFFRRLLKRRFFRTSQITEGDVVVGRVPLGGLYSLHWAITSDGWTISPSQKLIERVIARERMRRAKAAAKASANTAAKASAKAAAKASANTADTSPLRTAASRPRSRPSWGAQPSKQPSPAQVGAAVAVERTWQKVWLGQHAGMRMNAKAFSYFKKVFAHEETQRHQRFAWRALPILNDWKRLFPQHDPAALYARIWEPSLRWRTPQTAYTWDAAWLTLSSPSYGHPGHPKTPTTAGELGTLDVFRGVAFGLSFEMDGLSVRAVLRTAKKTP